MKARLVLSVFSVLVALAAGLAASAAPLASLLPPPFLASLTPAARAQLEGAWAVPVPLPRAGPIGMAFPGLHLVLYDVDAPLAELRHEAMHLLDPCGADSSCMARFAASLPADLRATAKVLYGPVGWSPAEYWPVVPAWYAWDPAQIPAPVRSAYAGVFAIPQ